MSPTFSTFHVLLLTGEWRLRSTDHYAPFFYDFVLQLYIDYVGIFHGRVVYRVRGHRPPFSQST